MNARQGPAREGQQRSLPGLSGAVRSAVCAARARMLPVGHFAFMRSVVQGLDLRQSWERYFRVEGDDSSRNVQATIQWIRDEFAADAKRQAKPGTARLVLLDVSRIGDPKVRIPDLEDFAVERALPTSARPSSSRRSRRNTGRRAAEPRDDPGSSPSSSKPCAGSRGSLPSRCGPGTRSSRG